MSTKIAFAGFRHGHILSLYGEAQRCDEIEVVAACEEDDAAREATEVEITHASIDTMLDEVDCDVVAIGDYYGKRGSIAIRALQRGMNVIADKPLCTSLQEQAQIEESARAKGLKVGCMLDLRDSAIFLSLREVVQSGRIGEIHAVSFGGQHPLMVGSRPGWYFEPGKHGGTINDIAIHALDYIPWATGLAFRTVNAARAWNAFATETPHFHGGAQMMLTMENGCGVLGDVSYFAPNSQGYKMPFYWRTTFWGRKGVAEASSSSGVVTLALDGDEAVAREEPGEGNPGGYLRDYLADLAGTPRSGGLTTDSVLAVSRLSLIVQKAADEGLREVTL